jgi:hypothetical protein
MRVSGKTDVLKQANDTTVLAFKVSFSPVQGGSEGVTVIPTLMAYHFLCIIIIKLQLSGMCSTT